jgi:hypothetical protein
MPLRSTAQATHLCCPMAWSLRARADSTSARWAIHPSSSARYRLRTRRYYTCALHPLPPRSHTPSSRPLTPCTPPSPRPQTLLRRYPSLITPSSV